MALEDELERIALDMERSVAYGMSWISHSEAEEFARRIRRAALTERKAPVEVEGLVEKMRRFAKTGRERRSNVVINSYHADTFDEVANALQSQATELATLKQQLAEASEPHEVFWMLFADDGRSIRKWSSVPFDGARMCRVGLPSRTDGGAQ